ncbi:phosphatidylinositol/phosphatidylcholine transfer protein SFH1-like isoform X2 [Primulina huaijiensis]|uniref:phosphatidylinositol/phosphatidylcholine transfer protein SFH1-like isoform X2 n=1 Tax=Primulina huaijiensis TaxID=1492673 RepID=UPI003CC72923
MCEEKRKAKMVFITEEMINQFQSLVEKIDEPLKKPFQNIHNGYERETLMRFLKARDGNLLDAHKMLIDCLKWRIQNEIDSILLKPIDTDVYIAVRESQLVGISGYSKEGLPVIAIGVGLSTYDKASIHYYVQSHIQMNEYRDRVILPSATKKYGRYIGTCIKILDMTGLKLSALSQIKVVKPLLRERTRKRVQVLSGSGRDDLLKIMDYQALPHFCRREGSGSSRHSSNGTVSDCFSFNHPFHQQLYNYIKEQSAQVTLPAPIKHGSFHVDFPEPDPEGVKIAQTIESEFQRLGNQNGVSHSLHKLNINGD